MGNVVEMNKTAPQGSLLQEETRGMLLLPESLRICTAIGLGDTVQS